MTLEGLGSRERPDPVQDAFIEEQAAQCGYCLNGMIMTHQGAAACATRILPKPKCSKRCATICAAAARISKSCARRCAPPVISPRRKIDGRAGVSDESRTSARIAVGRSPGCVRREGAFETFIKITADGSVTAYNGHVDLGTGIRTALGQIVAEELDVSFARVVVVLGDTSRVPNQGATIASETIQITAVPLRKAAAQARHFLIARAAERLELAGRRPRDRRRPDPRHATIAASAMAN